MKTDSEKSSALLRGALWNGAYSPLVRKIEGAGQEGFAIFDSLHQLAEQLAPESSLPPRLSISGVGAFALGSDPDQLERNSAGDSSPVNLGHRRGLADTLRKRIAVVTGGAQGFGRELVLRLVESGAFVWIADMNGEGARSLASEINREQNSRRAFAVEVNVTDEDSVAQMIESVADSHGGIDLFINNAGVLKAGSVKELSIDDFSFVTDVNYIGYFLCVKHVSSLMAAQSRGDLSGSYYSDIIQINSKSGLSGSNRNSAYAGGKFGGIGLTQSFALELVEDRIKVNSICPGNFFDGPLWSDPDRGLFVQYLRTGKVPGAKSIQDVKAFYEAKVPMKRGCGGEDLFRAIYYCVQQLYETGQAVPVTGGQIMLS